MNKLDPSFSFTIQGSKNFQESDKNKKDMYGYTQLMLLCVDPNNNLYNIARYLRLNPDLNIKDRESNTALHYLCKYLQLDYHGIEIINEFIKKGANINSQNNKGETPLMINLKSKFTSDEKVAEYLIKIGANISILDKDKKSILYYSNKTSIRDKIEKPKKFFDTEECISCLDKIVNKIGLSCGHVLCKECSDKTEKCYICGSYTLKYRL